MWLRMQVDFWISLKCIHIGILANIYIIGLSSNNFAGIMPKTPHADVKSAYKLGILTVSSIW